MNFEIVKDTKKNYTEKEKNSTENTTPWCFYGVWVEPKFLGTKESNLFTKTSFVLDPPEIHTSDVITVTNIRQRCLSRTFICMQKVGYVCWYGHKQISKYLLNLNKDKKKNTGVLFSPLCKNSSVNHPSVYFVFIKFWP